VEECGPCPVFASFTLAFALQLRKKHGKTSVTDAGRTFLLKFGRILNRVHVNSDREENTVCHDRSFMFIVEKFVDYMFRLKCAILRYYRRIQNAEDYCAFFVGRLAQSV
jgi:hypothetical protein